MAFSAPFRLRPDSNRLQSERESILEMVLVPQPRVSKGIQIYLFGYKSELLNIQYLMVSQPMTRLPIRSPVGFSLCRSFSALNTATATSALSCQNW